MYKQIKIAIFTGLLTLPVFSSAQTQICKTANIRATTPTNQFINHNNGTVTDKKTGLMWKKCIEGQVWDNARKDCKGELGGYNWQEALNHAQTINRLFPISWGSHYM